MKESLFVVEAKIFGQGRQPLILTSNNPYCESIENQYKLKCGHTGIKSCCDLIVSGSAEDDSKFLGPTSVYFTQDEVLFPRIKSTGMWTPG